MWLLAFALAGDAEWSTLERGEPPETPAERGEYLYRVAGCVGCHTPPGSDVHLGGGRDNPTMFGTFYAPNISPHPTDGIGDWTEDDFFRAMRKGRSPEGRTYWPTFPYMAYTKMTDDDLAALWAYLRSQPAVEGRPPPHEPKGAYKNLLWAWRMIEFDAGPYEPDPDLTEQENHGAYLVEAVSYCDQCHTPRGKNGLLKRRKYMAGGANPGKDELHPNLTPHPETGIGTWSEADIVHYLRTGVGPDGVETRPDWVMREKVDDSFGWYTDADLEAIAAYLKTLEPVDLDVTAQGWIDE